MSILDAIKKTLEFTKGVIYKKFVASTADKLHTFNYWHRLLKNICDKTTNVKEIDYYNLELTTTPCGFFQIYNGWHFQRW